MVIILPKDELDKANKDTKHYPPGFQVWDTLIVQFWSRIICTSLQLDENISFSITYTQVHVVLSDVTSEPHVECDDEVDSRDDADDDEDEDLSDTDPEDESNSSTTS